MQTEIKLKPHRIVISYAMTYETTYPEADHAWIAREPTIPPDDPVPRPPDEEPPPTPGEPVTEP